MCKFERPIRCHVRALLTRIDMRSFFQEDYSIEQMGRYGRYSTDYESIEVEYIDSVFPCGRTCGRAV